MNISSNKFILIWAAASMLSGCAKKQDYSGPLNSFKRYPYEHFHISYEISGDGRGTEDVYVSGYGKNEAQHSKTEMFSPQGISSEDNTLLTKGADLYGLDNMRRTYTHTHVTALDSIFHLGQSDIPTVDQYMENEMRNNLLKNAGYDTIAGKRATKWQLIDGDMTMWVWNGILLRKTAGSEDHHITMNFVSLDTAWAVDSTKFMIPAGYHEVKPEDTHASEPN